VLPPIRCTEQEKNLIVARAKQAGLSISEYVRNMSLKGHIHIRQSSLDFEALHELKKIGVNVNQQTKKLNATGKLSFELLEVQKKLEQLLDKLLAQSR